MDNSPGVYTYATMVDVMITHLPMESTQRMSKTTMLKYPEGYCRGVRIIKGIVQTTVDNLAHDLGLWMAQGCYGP